MTLVELIAKLESASYGSGTLDDMIFEYAQGYTPCWTGPVGGGVFDQPAWFRELPRNCIGASVQIGRAPGFTSSMESAMGLMESGWRFTLDGPGSGYQTPHDASCKIYVQENYAFNDELKSLAVEAKAATSALAICAAALRARVALHES